MVNQIKFSHDYMKFPYCNMWQVPCRLIEVIKTHYKELSEEFKRYDTHYIDGDDEKYYPLPKTDLLILVFSSHKITPPPVIFTTIRRWTPKKEEHYRSKIGEEFEIVIKNGHR